MDVTILVAAAAVIVILIFALKLLSKKQQQKGERPRPVPVRQRDAAPRRAQLVRNRGTRARGNVNQNVAIHDESDDDENNQDTVSEKKTEIPDGKIGAKKRAKLEAKAEKKAHREAEEQLRAEKKKKEHLAEVERKKAEEKEQAELKRIEEEERKAREEKERREHEEYLKMKEAFLIEEEGFEENDSTEQNLLQEFVTYIKQNKVVVIEDLASYFKMKTQVAIERIKDLQKDNILTGVIDDRGKFIYITVEEMEAVAKFIKQHGRITISELVENSNKLINLTPLAASH